MRTRVLAWLGSALIAGAVAFFIESRSGSAGTPDQPSSRQTNAPTSDDVTTFAVFRRSRTADDDLPPEFASWPVPDIREMDLADARLAYRSAGTRFYLVPLRDSEICLVTWDDVGGSGLSCTTIASASNPGTPMFVTGSAGVYGIVPDSVHAGSVDDAHGTSTLTAGENLLVDMAVDRPMRVTLNSDDGSQATTNLVPGTPVDKTSASSSTESAP